jgi:hypothetical protein
MEDSWSKLQGQIASSLEVIHSIGISGTLPHSLSYIALVFPLPCAKDFL